MTKFTFYYMSKGTDFESYFETASGRDIIGKPVTFKVTTLTPMVAQRVVIEADNFEEAERIYKQNYLPKQ